MMLIGCGGGADGVSTPIDRDLLRESPVTTISADPFPESSTASPTVTPSTTVTATTIATTASTSTPPSTAIPTTIPTSIPTTPATTTTTPALVGWDAFDDHLTTILDAGSTAVSATVLRDGDVVHEVALGVRTLAGEPVAVGDRYRIASISKVITAITALRLVELGLLDLDAPVGPRLAGAVGVSNPAVEVGNITLRHLMTHRSGIAQYEDLMFKREVESCPEAGAVALSRALERSPGTTFRYSNVNFCLVGLLIENVTGRPYADVAAENVLDPLGISGMRLAGTFDVLPGDVEHESDAGRNYMEVLGAAGSWIASPTDVATIVNSLDLDTPGWKPLGEVSVATMRTITLDPPPPPAPTTTTPATTLPSPPRVTGYGIGLMIFGVDAFGHTGTLEATHAMTVRQPDGITWAITVSGVEPNSTRALAGIMAEAFAAGGFA